MRSGPRDPEGPTDQEAGRNQRSRTKAGRSGAEAAAAGRDRTGGNRAEPDGGAILREKKASAGPPALRRVLDGIGPDGGRGQAPPHLHGVRVKFCLMARVSFFHLGRKFEKRALRKAAA